MRSHLWLQAVRGLLALLITFAAVDRANAQDPELPELTDLFGTIASPELSVPIDMRAAALDAPEKKFFFFASIGVTDTDTALAPSLSLGASTTRTQLDIRYANLDLDDDSVSLDQFRLRLRHKIVVDKPLDKLKLNLTATAQHLDLENSSETSSISLDGSVGEQNVAALVWNVGYAEKQPDTGMVVNDWVIGVGVSFNVSADLIFGLDYTFENDVAKSDAYSFTATHALQGRKISFGVAKEGALYASYTVGF